MECILFHVPSFPGAHHCTSFRLKFHDKIPKIKIERAIWKKENISCIFFLFYISHQRNSWRMSIVANMTSEIWNKDEEWALGEEHADISLYEIISVEWERTENTSNITAIVFLCLRPEWNGTKFSSNSWKSGSDSSYTVMTFYFHVTVHVLFRWDVSYTPWLEKQMNVMLVIFMIFPASVENFAHTGTRFNSRFI
jgi:hypothetical protein